MSELTYNFKTHYYYLTTDELPDRFAEGSIEGPGGSYFWFNIGTKKIHLPNRDRIVTCGFIDNDDFRIFELTLSKCFDNLEVVITPRRIRK